MIYKVQTLKLFLVLVLFQSGVLYAEIIDANFFDDIEKTRLEKSQERITFDVEKEKERAEKEMDSYNEKMEDKCYCVFNFCGTKEGSIFSKMRSIESHPDNYTSEARDRIRKLYEKDEEFKRELKRECKTWANKRGSLEEYNNSSLLEKLASIEKEIADENRYLSNMRVKNNEVKKHSSSSKSKLDIVNKERDMQNSLYSKKQLEICLKAWSDGDNPCECDGLKSAPAWARERSTCSQ